MHAHTCKRIVGGGDNRGQIPGLSRLRLKKIVPYDCDHGCTCEGKPNALACIAGVVHSAFNGRIFEFQTLVFTELLGPHTIDTLLERVSNAEDVCTGAGVRPWTRGGVCGPSLASKPATDAMLGFMSQHLDLANAECRNEAARIV